MADALDSKSSIRKNVWVQVPPPVLALFCRDSLVSPVQYHCATNLPGILSRVFDE